MCTVNVQYLLSVLDPPPPTKDTKCLYLDATSTG